MERAGENNVENENGDDSASDSSTKCDVFKFFFILKMQ